MNPIHVSPHAIRRYFERVKKLALPFAEGDDAAVVWWIRSAGINVNGVREEIRRTVSSAVAVGATSVKSGNMRFVIDGRTVVTVKPTARTGRTSTESEACA